MQIITVNPSDTVFSIAREYGLNPQKIIDDNGLDQNASLAVGQSLVLLFPKQTYVPYEDELLSSVAEKFGVSEKTLLRNNIFLGGRNYAPAGRELVISYDFPPESEKIITGYAYDFISNSLLDTVISYMTYLIPFTYGFTPGGDLIYPDDENLTEAALNYSVKPLMHLSTLTANGVFSNELAHELLSDQNAVSNLIANCLENIKTKGYYGIDIDFEYLFAEDKEAYVDFIRSMTETLNANGLLCVVALPPKYSSDQSGLLYEGIDYASLGNAANYVFLMTYEWGYRYGPPLAVAPVNSVRRIIEYALSVIPSEKILLGISNYGYDWPLPYERGITSAISISTVEAVDTAVFYKAEISFDESAKAPFFFYTDEKGREHVVWYEDSRSFEAKTDLIKEYSLAGGGIWNLMRENPQGYVTLNSLLNIK